MVRSSPPGAGEDEIFYYLSTTGPNFYEGGGREVGFPTSWLAKGSLGKVSNKVISNDSGNNYQVQTLLFQDQEYSLQPNTTYYIWLYSETPASSTSVYTIYVANGGGRGNIAISLELGATIEPEPEPEPEPGFQWDTPKSDTSWSISASEWNRFCEKLKEKTGIIICREYQAGDYLTTEQFNEIAKILNLKYRVFSKNQFMGRYFNDLAEALNKLSESVSLATEE